MPFDDILGSYFPGGQWRISEGRSGWNNTTRFVEAEGRRYVLRIYETHKDEAKIAFEHEVLLALSGASLPFAVPVPERCSDGGTYVRLRDGTGRYACLFGYMDGDRPTEGDPEVAGQIGFASGKLSRAFEKLRVGGEPAYPPYYEMDSAHPLCSPDRVRAFCAEPPGAFASEAGDLRAIGEALKAFRGRLPAFRTLPHQLVHGDINHSNLLARADGGCGIAAVLDFEFCTWDLRAMEPAVIAAGLLDSERDEASLDAFLEEFGKHAPLTAEEAIAIPALVRLRKLDVFLHFLGRYWDGVDDAGVLREQILSCSTGLARLDEAELRLERKCLRLLAHREGE